MLIFQDEVTRFKGEDEEDEAITIHIQRRQGPSDYLDADANCLDLDEWPGHTPF